MFFTNNVMFAGISFLVILILGLLFFRKKSPGTLEERAKALRTINSKKSDLVRTFQNNAISKKEFEKIYSRLDSEAKRLMAA